MYIHVFDKHKNDDDMKMPKKSVADNFKKPECQKLVIYSVAMLMLPHMENKTKFYERGKSKNAGNRTQGH